MLKHFTEKNLRGHPVAAARQSAQTRNAAANQSDKPSDVSTRNAAFQDTIQRLL
jgi:hypothetical protein